MESKKVDWKLHVKNKYVQHVKNIGDIDVYANETTVYVAVDDETVLAMMRDGHQGLSELAEVLASLVK